MKLNLFKNSFCILVLLCFANLVYGQTPSTPNLPSNNIVYSDWQLSGESASRIAVSYRVVKCDSVNEVQLKLVNNVDVDQNINIHLVIISNATGDQITKDLSISLLKLQHMMGDCFDTNSFGLRIDLPVLYNPTDLKITTSF